MQTPKSQSTGRFHTSHWRRVGNGPGYLVFACVAALVLLGSGCKKEAGMDAIQSDANGYLCLKCDAKLYTARTVFIDPRCPKCQEDTLMRVVGYYCEKDKHLTIRASRGDNRAIVCEVCQTPLVNAMQTPKEADLKKWGATQWTQ